MAKENRRDERFDTRQKLWCEGQTAVEARNMSRSGMFIVSDTAADVGEHLTISFSGDEGEVEVDAEVMWRGESEEAGKDGMGLRIVGFKKGQSAFDRLIEKHTTGEMERPEGVGPNEGNGSRGGN